MTHVMQSEHLPEYRVDFGIHVAVHLQGNEGTRQSEAQSSPDRHGVLQVRANGLVVFVPKYGIEGPVYLTEKAKAASMQGLGRGDPAAKSGGEDFQLDEDQQMIASKDSAVRIRIFDKAAVRISIVEGTGHRRQLLLQLVEQSLLPPSELASA